jgi:hypothetical protein
MGVLFIHVIVLSAAKDKNGIVLQSARCRKTKDRWNYTFVLAAAYFILTLKQRPVVFLFSFFLNHVQGV